VSRRGPAPFAHIGPQTGHGALQGDESGSCGSITEFVLNSSNFAGKLVIWSIRDRQESTANAHSSVNGTSIAFVLLIVSPRI
jgi:hypothetical protein